MRSTQDAGLTTIAYERSAMYWGENQAITRPRNNVGIQIPLQNSYTASIPIHHASTLSYARRCPLSKRKQTTPFTHALTSRIYRWNVFTQKKNLETSRGVPARRTQKSQHSFRHPTSHETLFAPTQIFSPFFPVYVAHILPCTVTEYDAMKL